MNQSYRYGYMKGIEHCRHLLKEASKKASLEQHKIIAKLDRMFEGEEDEKKI